MKIGTAETLFSLSANDISPGPFPVNGFLPLFETDFGNGDYYGLYWPIGRENETPIVCELFHDEWRLTPVFSNALMLSQWLEQSESDQYSHEIVCNDAMFAGNLFQQSLLLRQEQKVEEAIHYCKMACNAFPESSEYWLTLANLYQQSKNPVLSIKSALNAYLSLWGFGIPNDKVLYFLKQGMNFNEFSSDPVIKRVADGSLNLNFGGAKTNQNYTLMQECIAEYFMQNQPISALKLLQNYAYAMYAETSAFQERYEFDIEKWKSDYRDMCSTYLNDSRSSFTGI